MQSPIGRLLDVTLRSQADRTALLDIDAPDRVVIVAPECVDMASAACARGVIAGSPPVGRAIVARRGLRLCDEGRST